MKYAVDKIEGNIAVLESLEDKTKKEVLVDILPPNTVEGSILTYEKEAYNQDKVLEEHRKKTILNKFNMLKKEKVDNH